MKKQYQIFQLSTHYLDSPFSLRKSIALQEVMLITKKGEKGEMNETEPLKLFDSEIDALEWMSEQDISEMKLIVLPIYTQK